MRRPIGVSSSAQRRILPGRSLENSRRRLAPTAAIAWLRQVSFASTFRLPTRPLASPHGLVADGFAVAASSNAQPAGQLTLVRRYGGISQVNVAGRST